MLLFLSRCLPAISALRRAAGTVRRVARRTAPSGALPHVARRAAVATSAVKIGGLTCLLAPLLAPAPGMGPQDMPAANEAGGGTPSMGLLLGDLGAGQIEPGSGLMAASASVTGYELRTLRGDAGDGGGGGGTSAGRTVVVVPEPAAAALFATGAAALLWAHRRRPRGGSGLDGAKGGR